MSNPPKTPKPEYGRVLETEDWCIALTTEYDDGDDDPTPPPIRGPSARRKRSGGQ